MVSRTYFPLVSGKTNIAVFYHAMRGSSIDEIADAVETVSGRTHPAEIVERLETYRDRGLLDEDYLPTDEGRELGEWLDADLALMPLDRLGEVYEIMNTLHAPDVLEAVAEDRYDDFLEEDDVFPEHARSAYEMLEDEKFISDGELTELGWSVYNEMG